ncbi:hypothetical protein AB0L74_30440 [Streptomyces sp. NPDC052020]|uniref:hypothetical protein n=1 Tax=Streptomyces sp. NPDC052020 TaxID=3155677 RepID=UPI00342B9F51
MSANKKVLNSLGYVGLISVIVGMGRYIMLANLGEPQHECFDAACAAFMAAATLGLLALTLFTFAARRGPGDGQAPPNSNGPGAPTSS